MCDTSDHFNSLPPEIIIRILKYLDRTSVGKIQRSNKRFNDIIRKNRNYMPRLYLSRLTVRMSSISKDKLEGYVEIRLGYSRPVEDLNKIRYVQLSLLMPAQAAICILFQLSLDRASQVAFINCYDLKFVEMLTRLFNSLRDEKFTYSSISKQFDSGVLRMEFPTTFLAPLKSHDHDIDDLEIATMQMKQVHPGSSNYLQGSWFTIIEKSVSTTNKSTYILDRYSNSMIDIIVDIQDICFDPAILTNLWSSILNYGIRLRKEKFIMVNELDKISPVSLFSTFASLQYEFEEVPPELVNFPGKKAARMYYKREFYIPKSDDLHDALFIIGAINTDLFEPRIAYEEFYGRNFHIIA